MAHIRHCLQRYQQHIVSMDKDGQSGLAAFKAPVKVPARTVNGAEKVCKPGEQLTQSEPLAKG